MGPFLDQDTITSTSSIRRLQNIISYGRQDEVASHAQHEIQMYKLTINGAHPRNGRNVSHFSNYNGIPTVGISYTHFFATERYRTKSSFVSLANAYNYVYYSVALSIHSCTGNAFQIHY